MKEISQIQAALRLHTGRDTISLCQSFTLAGKLAAKGFNCRSSGAEPGPSPCGSAVSHLTPPQQIVTEDADLHPETRGSFVLMDISEGISKEGAEGGNNVRRNSIRLERAVKCQLWGENGLFGAFPPREILSVHTPPNGPSVGCGVSQEKQGISHCIISLRAL